MLLFRVDLGKANASEALSRPITFIHIAIKAFTSNPYPMFYAVISAAK
jgi:hypothetical protein